MPGPGETVRSKIGLILFLLESDQHQGPLQGGSMCSGSLEDEKRPERGPMWPSMEQGEVKKVGKWVVPNHVRQGWSWCEGHLESP